MVRIKSRRVGCVGKWLDRGMEYGAFGHGGKVWLCRDRCWKSCAMCGGVPRKGSWQV